jgi:hypothetical protein
MPVSQPQRLEALVEPAIDENRAVGRFQQIARPGDGSGGAEKAQPRRSLGLSDMIVSLHLSDTAMPATQRVAQNASVARSSISFN